jgi:iron complex transport system substrate-binding protein
LLQKDFNLMKFLKVVMGIGIWISIMTSCKNETAIQSSGTKEVKIVSLNGAISEIIASIGEADKLAGVDVASTYPDAIAKLPKTGHNRNINAEAVIALQPTHVYTLEESLQPEIATQLQAAGIIIVNFKEPKSVAGVRTLVEEVGKALQREDAANELIQTLDADLKKLLPVTDSPRVMFIYARGAGALSVAGSGTAVHEMLRLSGARNAAADVEGYKPYTSEAAVKANPDILLLFDSGLESLGGKEGLLSVPGIAQTNAGKNKSVYAMDGLLLSGFTPRCGKALQQLQTWFQEQPKP